MSPAITMTGAITALAAEKRATGYKYDTEERVVEFHRVPYDVETSAQKIFDADLALNFGKRLFLGV